VGQLCRGVLARLQPARDALEPVRGARFNGLTLDFGDIVLPDAQLDTLLRIMGLQMRGKAPGLIALGLGDARHQAMADAAGFTHAGLRTAPVTVEAKVA